MNINFSSEDVREHLESLGYKNISEDQLKDFVRDLRRLIRYEEKQKRLQKLMEAKSEENQHADQVDKVSQVHKVKGSRVKKTIKRETKTTTYNEKTGDLSVTSDSVSMSCEESQVEILDEIKVTVVNKNRLAEPLRDIQVGELKQILPPRPELPTKPTCSWIKPKVVQPKRKDLKHDPVQLHQFYKKHWEKQRLPGEFNRTEKDIRWATREWMNDK